MCGRYALYGPPSRLRATFDLADCPEIAPRYNIAPQSDVLVVRQRPDGRRVGSLVRWGLIPGWAKGPDIGRKLGNARAESVAAKPAFRSAFKRFRCLIPANGFYEWKTVEVAGKPRKQPYFIRPVEDEGVFALAGLLERWVDPAGQEIPSTCVITTAANELMAPIHDRMPVIIAPEHFDDWLDPKNQDAEVLRSLLAPAPSEEMLAVAVSTAVNRAGNEGPELLASLENPA